MSVTETAQSDELLERLRSFVGTATVEPRQARDPVNEPMIRHWCEALGDRNPAYTDPGWAKWSVHGGIVAPPTMLQAWTMRGLDPDAPTNPGSPGRPFMAALEEAGYTSVVATNCEQEYERYLRPGEVVCFQNSIESVSERKQTSLGKGYFFTIATIFTDGTGEVVGRQRFRMFGFAPLERPAVDPSPSKRPRPAINQDTEFFWDAAKRGELLIQRCAACGELRHPPRTMCGVCGSFEWDTLRASGRGEVYSFVVHHHPPVPGFEIPYVVALIALEEGTRLVSNVVGIAPDQVQIGLKVELDFLKIDDALTIPVFRPRT